MVACSLNICLGGGWRAAGRERGGGGVGKTTVRHLVLQHWQRALVGVGKEGVEQLVHHILPGLQHSHLVCVLFRGRDLVVTIRLERRSPHMAGRAARGITNNVRLAVGDTNSVKTIGSMAVSEQKPKQHWQQMHSLHIGVTGFQHWLILEVLVKTSSQPFNSMQVATRCDRKLRL